MKEIGKQYFQMLVSKGGHVSFRISKLQILNALNKRCRSEIAGQLTLCFRQLLPTLYLSSMDICDSETGDGCGLCFPRKSSPGLCAKCHKLASLDQATPEY